MKLGCTDTADSFDRVTELFVSHGLPAFPPVIESLMRFGGYCLPFKIEGRFKVFRPKVAVRRMAEPCNKSDNPDDFRILFGESESIQSFYLMDGHGHLFEDDRLLANDIASWIEDWAT